MVAGTASCSNRWSAGSASGATASSAFRHATRCAPGGSGGDAKTEVVTDGQVVESAAGNPLDFIAAYQQRFKVALRPGMPRFCGGLAGYFGYDAVRYIEKKLQASCPPDTLGCPDILLLQ